MKVLFIMILIVIAEEEEAINEAELEAQMSSMSEVEKRYL